MTKEKNPYIVYLTRSNMIWAGDSLKELISVEFAGGVFVDLEFPNVGSFNNQLLTTVEQFGIKPNRVIFVLNQELYYTQLFAATAQEEIKSYLSIVPFDEVVSKEIPTSAGVQVAAVSKDLIEPLVEVFTHHDFDVIAIFPDMAFGELLKTPDQFTIQITESILPALVPAEGYNFYTPVKLQEGMTSIRDSEGHIFNPRLIVMILFFIVLIFILVIVLFMNGYIGQPKKVPVIPQPGPEVMISPTLMPAVDMSSASVSSTQSAEASTSASISLKIQTGLSIEVLNGSGVSGEAEQVKSALSKLGFTNVSIGNSSSSGSKTLVLYKPNVSTDSLQAITDGLQAQGLESSAQENPDLTTVDVRIMTGKK